MSQHGRHPVEFAGCAECDAGADTWQKNRRLPQIGQTYECINCGHEIHIYDAGDPGETIKQCRPVADQMATNLQFFAEVGDWPDSVLDDLFKQGLERAEAIDYHMVEVKGLSQTQWAEKTERRQPSVSENVSKACEKLEKS
jgi:predicted XRE-type DNA-binding protein